MPITTSPFLLKDVSVTLKLASDTTGEPIEYKCQLRRAELVPGTAGGGGGTEYTTFCDTFSAGGSAGGTTWELALEGFQAFADATDLALFLFDHDGETADFELLPKGGTPSATNPGFKGQVTLVPTNIGGTANEYAQFSVTLPVVSKPTKVVA
jgi:hypothetical protein